MTSSEPCPVPVDVVLARLRQRAADIEEALDGNVLSLSIVVTDGDSKAYSVVFSPDGHLSVSRTESPYAWGKPDVRLRGTAEQVLQVVLGEVNSFTAVFADLMELSVAPAKLTPQYPQIMRLVREEVWALLEPDDPGH